MAVPAGTLFMQIQPCGLFFFWRAAGSGTAIGGTNALPDIPRTVLASQRRDRHTFACFLCAYRTLNKGEIS